MRWGAQLTTPRIRPCETGSQNLHILIANTGV
jgi:hypothetical protein